MKTAIHALNKAKIQLMSTPDSAFYTTVCFSVKHRFDSTIQTACTNGAEICFNPDFFMALSNEERVFLLLHETLHICYLHMDRLQERDPQKWNEAADHVINLQLIERGFQMPKMGLADTQYRGMGTEEVYKLLPEKDRSKQDQDLKPFEGDSEALQEAVQEILVRASVQSKMQGDKAGTIPGDIQLFLDNLFAPKLPWNRILQKYLHTFSKADYSYKKVNRRFFPQYFLPSLHSQKLLNIAIAVDISGSVRDSDFKTFVSEIHSMLRMMKPNKLNLIQFDTEIHSNDVIRSTNDLAKVKFKGRGGTDIRPVLQWANEAKPQLLLVFTDGAFRFFGASTAVKTIWLIHNNKEFTSPFGKTIHYDIKV